MAKQAKRERLAPVPCSKCWAEGKDPAVYYTHLGASKLNPDTIVGNYVCEGGHRFTGTMQQQFNRRRPANQGQHTEINIQMIEQP